MREGYEKRFNSGDIVYWCRQRGNEYNVEFGMVDEQYSDAVRVDFLHLKENRRVNGIPINEFPVSTKLMKLPKGRSYDTRLYETTYDDIFSDVPVELNSDIDNPEVIKKAYEYGLLVKDCEIFHGVIEAEITKDGYRIVKKYPPYQNHVSSASIRPDKCYFTYAEAKQEVDANIAEFHRQASLSDHDWSVEQIDKTLDRWASIYGVLDDEKERYRNWLLEMRNVEDIEVRIFNSLQWKYDKNKKWNNIEL